MAVTTMDLVDSTLYNRWKGSSARFSLTSLSIRLVVTGKPQFQKIKEDAIGHDVDNRLWYYQSKRRSMTFQSVRDCFQAVLLWPHIDPSRTPCGLAWGPSWQKLTVRMLVCDWTELITM